MLFSILVIKFVTGSLIVSFSIFYGLCHDNKFSHNSASARLIQTMQQKSECVRDAVA